MYGQKRVRRGYGSVHSRAEHLTVRFRKRNGGSFIKRFRSRIGKARAIRAWRAKGGKIVSSY